MFLVVFKNVVVSLIWKPDWHLYLNIKVLYMQNCFKYDIKGNSKERNLKNTLFNANKM